MKLIAQRKKVVSTKCIDRPLQTNSKEPLSPFHIFTVSMFHRIFLKAISTTWHHAARTLNHSPTPPTRHFIFLFLFALSRVIHSSSAITPMTKPPHSAQCFDRSLLSVFIPSTTATAAAAAAAAAVAKVMLSSDVHDVRLKILQQQ